MARPSDLERMSYAELCELELRIGRLKAEKQNAERAELRDRLASMAKEHGFDIRDLLDGRRKGKGGTVAVKYRDPTPCGISAPPALGLLQSPCGLLPKPQGRQSSSRSSNHSVCSCLTLQTAVSTNCRPRESA